MREDFRKYVFSVLKTDFEIDENWIIPTALLKTELSLSSLDYVRLITKEEVENLPDYIRKCSGDYGYWTISPSVNSDRIYVWFVYSSGRLDSYYAYTTGLGVRPVIYLKSNIELVRTNSEPAEQSTWGLANE